MMKKTRNRLKNFLGICRQKGAKMNSGEIAVTITVAIIGSGLFNKLLDYFINRKEKNNDEYRSVQKANRLIMKDRLRFLCMHYINQGWIYEDELEDIMAMHECYHNDLNGNGFLDKQMASVKQLEVRGIGVK